MALCQSDVQENGRDQNPMYTEVYLGLGSNLELPVKQLGTAINLLESTLDHIEVAPIYQSKPLGPTGQADYFNTVVRGWTTLDPIKLLDACQLIEDKQNRVRAERWGARTIDVDILYFGTSVVKTGRLTIPHPEILNRAFVVFPLLDLMPSGSSPGGDYLDRSDYDHSSLKQINQDHKD
jgi:2-amino-4-hydroxy-6-hydroxymethyldihydropteridine diphosphokinase